MSRVTYPVPSRMNSGTCGIILAEQLYSPASSKSVALNLTLVWYGDSAKPVLITVIRPSPLSSSRVPFLSQLASTDTPRSTEESISIRQVRVRIRPRKKPVSLGDPVMVNVGVGTRKKRSIYAINKGIQRILLVIYFSYSEY